MALQFMKSQQRFISCDVAGVSRTVMRQTLNGNRLSDAAQAREIIDQSQHEKPKNGRATRDTRRIGNLA